MAKRKSAAGGNPVILTRESIQEFLFRLAAAGRKQDTIRAYRRCLWEFYDFLPEEKAVTGEAVEAWRHAMRESGLGVQSMNLRLSAVNSLLRGAGEKPLLARHERLRGKTKREELTRKEYLRLLAAVRRAGQEQDELLIRSFAILGINQRDLPRLTVEACREGRIAGDCEKNVRIPPGFREELLQYAARAGRERGPVFVSRTGNPLDRSNIVHRMHRMADEAGLPREKCNPGALRRLCRTTERDIERHMAPLYRQMYDNLLDTEQTAFGRVLDEGQRARPGIDNIRELVDGR